MIGTIIYTLCTLTCVGCSILLWRGYRRAKMRLLFWSALCFAIMAVANALLILDLVVFPDIYLLPFRSAVTQIALLVLMYGLIMESD